jgi:hypothetical protein
MSGAISQVLVVMMMMIGVGLTVIVIAMTMALFKIIDMLWKIFQF